jgi:hypothetical protein
MLTSTTFFDILGTLKSSLRVCLRTACWTMRLSEKHQQGRNGEGLPTTDLELMSQNPQLIN